MQRLCPLSELAEEVELSKEGDSCGFKAQNAVAHGEWSQPLIPELANFEIDPTSFRTEGEEHSAGERGRRHC